MTSTAKIEIKTDDLLITIDDYVVSIAVINGDERWAQPGDIYGWLIDAAVEDYSRGDEAIVVLEHGSERIMLDNTSGEWQATRNIGSVYNAISEWDCDDLDECAAEWGIAPEIEAADESHEGRCKIWVEPQYYAGTINPPTAHYLRDGDEWDSPIRIFDTYADAEAWVDAYNSEPSAYDGIRECNVLSYGQAAADQLTIVADA